MSEDYLQPEFYRFNQDSLELVKWVTKKISSPLSILDLGAGSGIIGIELARILRPESLTLLELQTEYLPFLKANVRNFVPITVACEIVVTSFGEYRALKKFQLIVSNPPYYLPGRGELPANQQRAKARSFLIDSWGILLDTVSASLASEGSCWMVLKDDDWLFDFIQKEARKAGLTLEREVSLSLMFLLFRLNID